MNKKGASLVELIAVIVILGIISSIAAITVTQVVIRQKKNAVISSLNNIYSSAKSLLVQTETDSYDENITVEEGFSYISLTTLIDSGNVDGSSYRPTEKEIYFCYDFDSCWVVIQTELPTNTRPSSTNSTPINGQNVTFDFTNDKFIISE